MPLLRDGGVLALRCDGAVRLEMVLVCAPGKVEEARRRAVERLGG